MEIPPLCNIHYVGKSLFILNYHTLSIIDIVFSTQCAIIKGHKSRPNVTYAIPITNPISPTVIDLSDKSLECLNPKIAAYRITASIVAREVLENNFSNQFIKNPLSNSSSKADSINTIGIIEKDRSQFPFRFPNLETAL